MSGMQRGATLPPWIARNERHRRRMIEWVNARLDELDAADAQRQASIVDEDGRYCPPPEHAEKYYKWRDGGGLERAAADRGFIDQARSLVRSRWPYIADLVQLPPLKRGEKYRPELTGVRTGGQLVRRWRIASAAADVKRIRELWQVHYEGKKNRHPDDGPSAVQIAADRHGVSVEEVELKLKKFLRPK